MEVQPAQQEDHYQVHPDGEQDGRQDLQVQLRAQLSHPPEGAGTWKRGC